MKSSKWYGVLSIALSIPSTIGGLAYLVSILVERQMISSLVGYSLFFLVILSLLWLMVKYAFNKKS